LTSFTIGEYILGMEPDRALDTILKALGGDKVVAEEIGCGVSAISNWKVRRIPRGRMFDLLALAERKGVPLSIADVESANSAILAQAASE
jgi:hypothetical protein